MLFTYIVLERESIFTFYLSTNPPVRIHESRNDQASRRASPLRKNIKSFIGNTNEGIYIRFTCTPGTAETWSMASC